MLPTGSLNNEADQRIEGLKISSQRAKVFTFYFILLIVEVMTELLFSQRGRDTFLHTTLGNGVGDLNQPFCVDETNKVPKRRKLGALPFQTLHAAKVHCFSSFLVFMKANL